MPQRKLKDTRTGRLVTGSRFFDGEEFFYNKTIKSKIAAEKDATSLRTRYGQKVRVVPHKASGSWDIYVGPFRS